MERDYFIVGAGIAGLSLSEQLRRRGKSFIVFDSGRYAATAVAGGVVNPVVVKRLNSVWRAKEFLGYAHSFYQKMAFDTEIDFLRDLQLYRPFDSVAEQNTWMSVSDRPDLSGFLNSKIEQNNNPGIKADHGLGCVSETFRLDTKALLKGYKNWLTQNNSLVEEQFDHDSLHSDKGKWQYKEYSAERIIFAEGYHVLANPYWQSDALIPKKGEYLIISATNLKLEHMIKGRFFIIPLGNDQYQVGATFAHDDLTLNTTEQGREQMLEYLQQALKVQFEVVDQLVGMRPTVKDRRPLMGRHNKHDNMAFLNGMGTRGLLMAPLASQWLLDHLESDQPLPEEVRLKRFQI